jgi:hypothetical protein
MELVFKWVNYIATPGNSIVPAKAPRYLTKSETQWQGRTPRYPPWREQSIITVVTIDNKVHSDKIPAFLATNNRVGGALCADQMIASLKAKGIPLKGTVGLVNAMAGIEVFTDHDQGFRDRMNEIAPDVNVLGTPFTDNDIAKSLAASGDIGTSQGNTLIGIFADNAPAGVQIAKMITGANWRIKLLRSPTILTPKRKKT